MVLSRFSFLSMMAYTDVIGNSTDKVMLQVADNYR